MKLKKKIKYLLKNREKMESRIKILDNELNSISNRKNELEQILGDLYINYDEEDLKNDIERFEKSHEVKSGKQSKTLDKLLEMKKMLPYVIENGKIKENEIQKQNEKKDIYLIELIQLNY